MIAKQVTISGKVQGVWYRAWTKEQADRLGITGWVKNLAGGEVQALLVGEPTQIEEMLVQLHHGPQRARVDSVESVDVVISENLQDFVIRY